jgi:SnoaL-like domain
VTAAFKILKGALWALWKHFANTPQRLTGEISRPMSSLVHDDFRLEGAGLDGIGKLEFVAAMRAQLEAFPDYSENPSNLEENGDRVSFIAHVTGTQRGALALPGLKPIPPTGRAIHLPPEPAWIQVRDGKLFVYHVEAVPGGGVEGILNQLK